MKLKEVKINNLGTLKKYFDLTEVWGNIYNGVLLDCERMLEEQEAGVAGAIVEALEAYGEADKLISLASAFYQEGQWDLGQFWKKLEPLSAKSRDHDGANFCTRNARKLQNLIYSEVKDWNEERAAMLYLFALLMLQVKPREEISEKELGLIRERLLAAPAGQGNGSQRPGACRLYPYHAGVFYLKDGKIVNGEGKVFSPKEEEISGFAYTEPLGFIAFTKEGRLSASVEPNIKYELRERLGGRGGEIPKITMAAAYGQIYMLLLENRKAVSNVEVDLGRWEDVRWVGAGLNSVTAIRGKERNLLELGSDGKLTELSNVKEAYTYSGSQHRYAVLKESGILIMDDGHREEEVTAAGIGQHGYVYAAGREVIIREYGSERRKQYKVPTKHPITAVCRRRSAIYAYGEDGMLFSIEESQFL